MTNALRARRSCMAVPGSNLRFLEKAQGLASDQVFLDLEDSVAPRWPSPTRAGTSWRSSTPGIGVTEFALCA